MSKKMTFRKKSLAVILCLMMAAATLSGCSLEPPAQGNETEEDESSLEVPEVKGSEDEVGVFTLLVPKGMDAETTISDSEIMLVDEDMNAIILQVAEKDDAKEYVKSMMEDDDNFEEVEFTLDGTTWKGCFYKKKFVVWAKIDKKIVVATGDGFKYTDDITLAVLASIEVDSDAESVNLGGGIGAHGGTFTYGEGLYTVSYPGSLRVTDPASEFGDLAAIEGNQTIYVTSIDTWSGITDLTNEIERYYEYELETISIGDFTGYLYTYEDFWGDITADFIMPLDWTYRNSWGEMDAVYIHTSGATKEEALSEGFMEVINSVYVDPLNVTDEGPNTVAHSGSSSASGTYEGYWERGWYGFWIVYDAGSEFEDDIGLAYDCLASFDVEGDELQLQLVDSDGDMDFDCRFEIVDDGYDSGWLISLSGSAFGFDIGNYYDSGATSFYIDPEETYFILKDYIQFEATFYEDDDTWYTIKTYLRPWGSDFDDFYSISESDLPDMCVLWDAGYADMYPFNYDDWYVPQMNDPFPGIYAIEGN